VTGTGLDTTSSVVMGKTTVPTSAWRADSSTQLTILSTPVVPGPGPVEVIASNYWGRSPATVADVFRYGDGGPALPGERVVAEAIKYLGVPYLWAGASPSTGFDCSGFTMYVYSKLGVSLPHYSRSQATYGILSTRTWRSCPGTWCSSEPREPCGHLCGRRVDDKRPRSGDLVTIENVFRSTYVGARRMLSPCNTEQTDPRLTYVGAWTYHPTSPASGGSFNYTSAPGACVTVSFTGSAVELFALTGPDWGKALVTLDGGPATEVDFYSPAYVFQQSMYKKAGLAETTHTLTIRCTGESNSAASGNKINIDGLWVTGTLTQAPAPTLYQQTELVYAGAWTYHPTSPASAGSFNYTATKGATVTVSFTGTSVELLALTGPDWGKARLTWTPRLPPRWTSSARICVPTKRLP